MWRKIFYADAVSQLAIAEHQFVSKDTQLGVIGMTGQAYGTHLHLGFRYEVSPGEWSGSESISGFELARLEGLPIRSFLTECWPGTTGSGNASRYYPSSQ